MLSYREKKQYFQKQIICIFISVSEEMNGYIDKEIDKAVHIEIL